MLSEVTYKCGTCSKVHRLKFVDTYAPLLRWLMTCPKCQKYSLHQLVNILNPGQSRNGPVFRLKP